MTVLAHRIELRPNKTQEMALRKAVGVARFSYNWALARWSGSYEEHKKDPDNIPKPSIKAIKKEWSATKHDSFPWLKESPANANLRPFDDLGDAFKRFFSKKSKYPRFKKRGVSRDSFYVDNQKLRIFGKTATLPKIGKVKLTEELRYCGKILSGTVSREGDRWFLAVNVQLPDRFTRKDERVSSKVAGVDLGLKSYAIINSGSSSDPDGSTEIVDNPRFLRDSLKKLRHVQRDHARKVRGSKNRAKAAIKVNSVHRKVKNRRRDFQHKLTTRLCRENQVVVIETLNVAGMVKNRRLSRAISDAGWGEFERQIQYKAPLFGVILVQAGQFFASSRLCSACGWKCRSLNLSHRYWLCPCGACHDRDENAAKNLRTLGMRGGASGPYQWVVEEYHACGGPVRLPERSGSRDPVKQEIGLGPHAPA